MSKDDTSANNFIEKVLIPKLNRLAGIREDEEERKALRAVLRKVDRAQGEGFLDFTTRQCEQAEELEKYWVILPDRLLAFMIEEGARLSRSEERAYAGLLKHRKDSRAVIESLQALDPKHSKRSTNYLETGFGE